jgi:hypothetical protein
MGDYFDLKRAASRPRVMIGLMGADGRARVQVLMPQRMCGIPRFGCSSYAPEKLGGELHEVRGGSLYLLIGRHNLIEGCATCWLVSS